MLILLFKNEQLNKIDRPFLSQYSVIRSLMFKNIFLAKCDWSEKLQNGMNIYIHSSHMCRY